MEGRGQSEGGRGRPAWAGSDCYRPILHHCVLEFQLISPPPAFTHVPEQG